MSPLLIAQVALTLFVFVMLLQSAAVMVYFERKLAAQLQQRIGPSLVVHWHNRNIVDGICKRPEWFFQ